MPVSTNYWTKKSPYFEATILAGCKGLSVANHMYQPHSYLDPLEEYRHLTEGVTLWDVATERQIEITGPDAIEFMQLLTPRDVASCPVGKGQYTVITSAEGGIVNDPVMFRLSEHHFWLSCSDSDLILWVKGIAVFAGMNVQIHEADVSALQIQGPKSPQVIRSLFNETEINLDYYGLCEMELDGIPLVLSRTGWSSEIGYELFLRDCRQADSLWQKVLLAGQTAGIVVTGPSDISRVEAGILGYGCDISLDVNPYEAGLEWMLDFEKPADYIGKSALQQIRENGVKRRLIGIELDGPALAVNSFDHPWPVHINNKVIGKVTIALHSPRLDKNIGYAMLETSFSSIGEKVFIDCPFGKRSGRVVKKPFITSKRK